MGARTQTLLASLLALLGVFGVAFTQPGLAESLNASKAKDEVFVLPPPAQLHAAALGHDSALVDMLWAKMLVEYGSHMSEHRSFLDVTRYLDAIIELEPDYAPVYQFVDTLVVYNRPEGGTLEDARAARRYLERGVQERPGDANTWLHCGQFLAFLAPSFLPAGAELDAWRKDGAVAIMRAVDLGADVDRSVSAATLLTKYGEKDAAIRSLRRAYTLTDDPDDQRLILNQLAMFEASEQRDLAVGDVAMIDGELHDRLPFVSRGTFLLLAPTVDPLVCAGPNRSGARGCSREWADVLPSAHSL